MFVVDAHQDIAYNALNLGRDYRQSALAKRRAERGKPYGGATVGLPEAIAGRVALIFATLFVAPKSAGWNMPWQEEQYADQREAYTIAMKQLDYYTKLADDDNRIRIVESAADLDAVLDTWMDDKSPAQRVQGLLISMEGADPVLEPKQFEEWYGRGVRAVGPAWASTRYAAGNGYEGMFTRQGHELLEVMAGLNVILDITHLNERSAHEALDRYEGTVIASHSNARKFRDSDRMLTDDLIRKLAERDGVVGTVLYNRFLHPTWTKTDPRNMITLATIADAIDHVCQVTGNARHAGIGSDLDGGFGVRETPLEIDTVADLMRIADVLRGRGYDEDDVAAIMHGNMLRQVRAVLS